MVLCWRSGNTGGLSADKLGLDPFSNLHMASAQTSLRILLLAMPQSPDRLSGVRHHYTRQSVA